MNKVIVWSRKTDGVVFVEFTSVREDRGDGTTYLYLHNAKDYSGDIKNIDISKLETEFDKVSEEDDEE